MANDSKIVITASLQVPETVETIKEDLKKVQGMLESNPLQISCTISDSSIKQMQSQLDSLSKGLNINANVNAKSIQQSINQAVKSEPVRISVEADIKAGEIKRQAKELKEMWGIGFAGESKESIKALNAELQEMLTNYDKALKANDFEAMMSSWDKISEFVDKYAGSVKNLTPEMEKLNSIMRKTRVLITEDDYKELERIYETRGEIQKVLNDALGIGKWSYDKSKASYGFDSFVNEINSNLYGDDSINKISEEITEELKQISALRHADSQSTKEWEQYEEEILRQDANAWENHKNAVLNTLDAIRGETHSSEEFVDIFGDEEFQQTESNMQAFEDGLRKIEALKVQIKAEGGDAIKSVSASFTADANRNIDGFVLKVRKSSGEVENLYHKLQEAEDETGNLVREWERYKVTGSDAGVTKAIEQASKAADALGRKLNNLYAGATDENAARPIKTQSGKDAIAEAYNKATEAVNALRSANAATFAELDNEAKSAVDNLNNVIKAQRNAETAATKLRTKSVSEIKDEEFLNLDRFVANISNSAIPSIEHLKDEVDSLREQLQQVGEDDKQGLINYLIAFSNLEEEFKAINTEARTVKKALKELDNLTNSSQLKKNASNPEVASQVSDIQAIRNEYSKLLAELGQAKTPEAIQNISNRIAQLKPQFDAVVQSSKQLNDSLADKKASSDFNSKLNNLTNQMGTFERTNRRATESLKLMRDGVTTFAEEYQSIKKALQSGNLDDAALDDLAKRFRNLKGEANSAGLSVSQFFTNMQTQLRTVLQRWVSLYAVVGYIRQMANSVKELDSAMVELRKVTTATDAEFEKFLQSAGKTARQLGASISDVVNATATFSRAGFNLPDAEELGRIATLYKNVGDGIDIEGASESIISVMKAFNIEAEESERIIDRINKVSNNFAIDSQGLGFALQRVASAMRASNNTLDETIALTTVANEIVQNPEMVAQGWRTVALRIRGRITCLHIEKSICCV